MEQDTINQRLKFLVETLSVSSKAFSEAIGESPTNTHNYTSKRNAEPRAGYLQKVAFHFGNVNAYWLLTGQGEPFLSDPPTMTNENKPTIKKTKGNIQSNSGQTVNNITMADCEKDLLACRAELEASKNEVKLLRDQLALQASLVTSKDETINALRDSLKRLN
jgi:hypothetical protein